MKLRITILKYHSWYLSQISLQIMLLPILIFFFCEKVEISYGRYETQVTGAGTVEETGSVKARKHQR